MEGSKACPTDLLRGLQEGFGIYDGPDASVLEKNKDEIRFPDNPDRVKDIFDKVRGTRAQESKIDGSIWERDTSSHGGGQWKRWDNKRSWGKGEKPTSVWPDGRIRK